MSASTSSSTIRRLPLRQALASLRSGEGSTPLPSSVRRLTFRFVQKNSESGPREFLRTIAPRLAYANPSVPMRIERIPDPRSKSKDSKSPDAGAPAWEGGVPAGEMIVELEGQPPKTVSLSKLSPSQILRHLVDITGAPVSAAIEPPFALPSSRSSSGVGAEQAEAARTALLTDTA